MNGFFGTSATLNSDLSLVVTLALWVVALGGAVQARRKRFSKHCPVMAWAALLNWLPVLIVMVPTWLRLLTGTSTLQASLIPVGHGILGAVVQLLMTYTVTRMYWVESLPPNRPLWLMRTTIGLWTLTAIGGVVVYFSVYVA
jgi:uncharacterized membrane protein YozB (DUF420 family)